MKIRKTLKTKETKKPDQSIFKNLKKIKKLKEKKEKNLEKIQEKSKKIGNFKTPKKLVLRKPTQNEQDRNKSLKRYQKLYIYITRIKHH
jgi:anion-transporting  ArsA/GET3 family ATPase